MSRSKKLLIAGLVLATGFGLAWPFRKQAGQQSFDSVTKTSGTPSSEVQVAETPAQPEPLAPLAPPAPQVVAKMTSTAEQHATTSTSFDLANHPALAKAGPLSVSPVTPPVPPAVQTFSSNYLPAQVKKMAEQARPAYATVDRDHTLDAVAEQLAEIRHVVQNSDTLEKLAKRYLGDEGRALEIFDLNRDLLDNPHLLPIEAELRLPADARQTAD